MIERKLTRNMFFGAGVLIVFINLLVLGGVYVNRSGEPEALLVLSERELSLVSEYRDENSGLAMRLNWRVFNPESDGHYSYYHQPEWLDKTKLVELGFDVEKYTRKLGKNRKYRRPLPRDVFIVLENNSPLHAKTVAIAESSVARARASHLGDDGNDSLENLLKNAEKNLMEEKFSRSRLYVIDAGLDPELLRAKYPQKDKYIIAAGVVRLNRSYTGSRVDIQGYIEQVSISTIHVSRYYRDFFKTILNSRSSYLAGGKPPRFKAQLAYGSRFEPWLVSLEKIEHPEN